MLKLNSLFDARLIKKVLLVSCCLFIGGMNSSSEYLFAADINGLSCDRVAKVIRGAMNGYAPKGVEIINAQFKEGGVTKPLAQMGDKEASMLYSKWKQCAAAGQSGGVSPSYEKQVTAPFLEKVAEAKKIDARVQQQKRENAERIKREKEEQERRIAEEKKKEKENRLIAEKEKALQDEDARLVAEKTRELQTTKRYFSVEAARKNLPTFYVIDTSKGPEWETFLSNISAFHESSGLVRQARELAAICTLVISGDPEFKKYDESWAPTREAMLEVYDFCPKYLVEIEQRLIAEDEKVAAKGAEQQARLVAEQAALDAKLNEAMNLVKNLHATDYPSDEGYKPFGKAFGKFFDKPSWKVESMVDLPGWIVTFTGVAQLNDNNARFVITFAVPKSVLIGDGDASQIGFTATVNRNRMNINELLAAIYLD